MPKYVVERNIPGAGQMSSEQLRGAAQTTCAVLTEMGPRIQWLESFVTDDKLYCIYIAPDEEAIEQDAAKGGFPCDHVSRIRRMIDPTTAEA